jgi:hypothetical protein
MRGHRADSGSANRDDIACPEIRNRSKKLQNEQIFAPFRREMSIAATKINEK